ncbi:hypothetical protein [Fusibacter sp. 3D3]|nr:hypothetical protein [Fusibacter sp. 3D3]GAU75552.1 hypothetical protein F3D3_0143 [Fusibacter sp. 3D3]
MKTQRTTLYYFSGTGNSKIVSELLTKEMAKAQGCIIVVRSKMSLLLKPN